MILMDFFNWLFGAKNNVKTDLQMILKGINSLSMYESKNFVSKNRGSFE